MLSRHTVKVILPTFHHYGLCRPWRHQMVWRCKISSRERERENRREQSRGKPHFLDEWWWWCTCVCVGLCGKSDIMQITRAQRWLSFVFSKETNQIKQAVRRKYPFVWTAADDWLALVPAGIPPHQHPNLFVLVTTVRCWCTGWSHLFLWHMPLWRRRVSFEMI